MDVAVLDAAAAARDAEAEEASRLKKSADRALLRKQRDEAKLWFDLRPRFEEQDKWHAANDPAVPRVDARTGLALNRAARAAIPPPSPPPEPEPEPDEPEEPPRYDASTGAPLNRTARAEAEALRAEGNAVVDAEDAQREAAEKARLQEEAAQDEADGVNATAGGAGGGGHYARAVHYQGHRVPFDAALVDRHENLQALRRSLAAAAKAADAVRRRLQLYREQSQSLPSGVPPLSPPPPPVDGLTLRARGWLRFLHRKACAPHGPGTHDDWSEHSPTGPHEWWDRVTGGPMSNFPRFDLHESAYAVLLYAQRTPAYRELYTAILDGLADRYRTHWSAVDFLNQFGPDDRSRAHYPEVWRGRLVPAESWREYDTPGWTANGCSPSATAAATAANEAADASAVSSLSDRAELD
eukprot:g2113.t1